MPGSESELETLLILTWGFSGFSSEKVKTMLSKSGLESEHRKSILKKFQKSFPDDNPGAGRL